jgi:hypothetical protein
MRDGHAERYAPFVSYYIQSLTGGSAGGWHRKKMALRDICLPEVKCICED